jgi:glucose-6-phosphate dehydrogenase assembly protein OpcA
MGDSTLPLLGEPRPANVADIEAELAALWRSAAEDTADGHAVIRACTLTLIVVVEDEEGAREVDNVVAELTRQNPARVIVLIHEPSLQPSGLTSWISAHCHLPVMGQKQVCSEQITVQARGESAHYVSSVVLPLTISGLPIHVWWRAGRFSPPEYFEQILHLANHVIVDSARFPEPQTDLAQLHELIARHHGALAVTDLNWSRITPWREILAQCFDSSQRRPYLDKLSSVSVAYEKESPRLLTQRSQSILLGAWMAGRLGWEFVGHREDSSALSTYTFSAQGRTVHFDVGAQDLQTGCGVCFHIELRAESGGTASTARFTFSRGPDGRVVQTQAEVPGIPAIGRSVRLEVFDEVASLNDELKMVGHDWIYEDTLRVISTMHSQ